jgi:hypothetical protein
MKPKTGFTFAFTHFHQVQDDALTAAKMLASLAPGTCCILYCCCSLSFLRMRGLSMFLSFLTLMVDPFRTVVANLALPLQ